MDEEARRILDILDEVSRDHQITQRALSRRLGVALGCTNLYLKRLINKGYIKVKGIPGKRYFYYLTPTGFTEKTTLSLRYMRLSWRYYHEIREQWHRCFTQLQEEGVERIVLCGIGEMSELAYLSLKETNLQVIAVVASERTGENFCGHKVEPLSTLKKMSYDRIILTWMEESAKVFEVLISQGVEKKRIVALNSGKM